MGRLCDCELSHNGLGLAGRVCDCPAGAQPLDREEAETHANEYILGKAVIQPLILLLGNRGYSSTSKRLPLTLLSVIFDPSSNVNGRTVRRSSLIFTCCGSMRSYNSSPR